MVTKTDSYEKRSKFCLAVAKICRQEGFDDCGDLCYQFIDLGRIEDSWTPEQAAQYCMQMVEQA